MHLKAIEAHPEAGRPPAGQHQAHPRGRGRGRQRRISTTSSAAHKAELKADVVVISDSAMFARGVPSICYGLRGLVYFQIDLRGSSTDLHSGSFGGAVANPAFVLAQMIAQMKDRGGRIKIPGFYDDVRPLQEEERQAWATLPFNETAVPEGFRHPEAVRRDRLHDARAHVGAAHARGQRPAVRVHRRGRQDRAAGRVDGQDQHAARAGSGSGQDRRAVRGLRAKARAEDRGAEDHAHARREAVDDLVRQPLRAGRGAGDREGLRRTPVFTREGGSIPVVSTFQEELGLPSVLFGVGLPDENAHAPNEKLDLSNFHNGIIASAHLYDEIGRDANSRSSLEPRRDSTERSVAASQPRPVA